MSTILSHSPEETEQAGQAFAKILKAGDVVALTGGLGAGKTAFVRGLARGLGYAGRVSSPTFAIVHEYDTVPPLYHFDMYRVETFDALFSTGFFDYLENGGILVIEWSENIEGALPEHTLRVSLEPWDGDENARRITLPGEQDSGD